MAGDEATRRRLARWLAAHAVWSGAGWIPLAFAFWFLPQMAMEGSSAVPDWILGSVFFVAALFVVPLVWPVLIALAWFEGTLAERVAGGDSRAIRTASRLLGALGLMFSVVAVVAGAVGIAMGDGQWEYREHPASDEVWDYYEFVAWAWIGPAVFGAAHLALARMFARNAPRTPLMQLSPLD